MSRDLVCEPLFHPQLLTDGSFITVLKAQTVQASLNKRQLAWLFPFQIGKLPSYSLGSYDIPKAMAL